MHAAQPLLNAPPGRASERAAERLLDALNGHGESVRAMGAARWIATCPSHDDRSPSLSVTYRAGDPGRVLVHCHAGCQSPDVVAALGLELRDLFDGSPERIPYQYDSGRVAWRVLEAGSRRKQFRQSGTDRPAELWRLAHVREGVEAGADVFVTEGEEDALTLEAIAAPQRIAATTAPMGAANWSQVDYGILAGAPVIVVADNDTAGVRRGLELTAHLESIGAHVRGVVTAHDGLNDVTDALAAWTGEAPMTLEDLRNETVAQYRARVGDSPDASELSSWLPRDVGSVLDALEAGEHEPERPTLGLLEGGGGLLYRGRVHSVAGESGSGKSWLLLAIFQQVLADGGTALMVDLEDGPGGVLGRLLSLGVSADVLRERFSYIRPDGPLTDADRAAVLAVAAQRVPDIVGYDSAGEGLALDGANPNDDADVARWFRRLPRALAALGSAVLLVDHVVKSNDDRGLWAIGSQRKRAAIDGASYIVEQRKGDAFARDRPGRARLTVAKDRHGQYRRGQRVADMIVTPSGSHVGIRLVAVEDDATSESDIWRPTFLMERVSRLLELATEPLSQRVLEAGVTGKAANVRAAARVLVDEGYVSKEAGPRGASLYRSVSPFREAPEPGTQSEDE